MSIEIQTTCPSCGRECPLATNPTDDDWMPEPGDVAMCVECEAPGLYDPSLEGNLRAPTADELAAIQAAPQWKDTIAALRHAKRLGARRAN